MSKVHYKVSDIAQQLESLQQPIVQLPYIDVPFTTIVGRSQMVDLANDLKPRFGKEVIMVQEIMPLSNEVGPAGETVFKPVNDLMDQIRFVGSWKNNSNSNGPHAADHTATVGNFIEISFVGTGLNLMTLTDTGTRDIRASIDGGAEGSNLYTQGSPIINVRNYSPNSIHRMATGLTYGLHTIKLRWASGSVANQPFGFEIINDASTIKVSPGTALVDGERLKLSAMTSIPYASDFVNQYGTAGAKGGNTIIYLKDGTIKKDIRWTEVSALYGSSATHANEEVISTHFFREFGAARTDDLSTLTQSATNRAYTLSDNTTTAMQVGGVFITDDNASAEGINPNPDLCIHFVGTGIDIEQSSGVAIAALHSVSIDGVTQLTSQSFNGQKTFKLASGLPYGTHVVRITETAGGAAPKISKFIVYGPKKPVLPDNAIELGQYFLMATFVANATLGTDRISTGVLRKMATREWIYSGTSTIGSNFTSTGFVGGFQVSNDAVGAFAQYNFFGMGFELRFRGSVGATDIYTASLDGSTNFTGFVTSTIGTGVAFTAATGVLDQKTASDQNGAALSVSNVTLGSHLIRFTNNTAGADSGQVSAIDLIVPTHAHKMEGPYVKNSNLRIGSESIADSRKFGIAIPDRPMVLVCENNSSNDVSSQFTGIWEPIGDAMGSFYLKEDSMVDVSVSASVDKNGGGDSNFNINLFVDQKLIETGLVRLQSADNDFPQICSLRKTICLPKGWHHAAFMMTSPSGTVYRIRNTHRTLNVQVVKKLS